MNTDTRCCGSGTCMIDAEGHCWCGQRWDGERMCHEAPARPESHKGIALEPHLDPPAGRGA